MCVRVRVRVRVRMRVRVRVLGHTSDHDMPGKQASTISLVAIAK